MIKKPSVNVHQVAESLNQLEAFLRPTQEALSVVAATILQNWKEENVRAPKAVDRSLLEGVAKGLRSIEQFVDATSAHLASPDLRRQILELSASVSPQMQDFSNRFDASSALGRIMDQVRELSPDDLSSLDATLSKVRSISWDDVLEAAEQIESSTPAGKALTSTSPKASEDRKLAGIMLVLVLIDLMLGNNFVPRLWDRFNALPLISTQLTMQSEDTHESATAADWANVAVATMLHSEPSEGSTTLFELQPGAWIRVLRQDRGWFLVEAETGESSRMRGWISARATKPLTDLLFEDAFAQLQSAKASKRKLAVTTQLSNTSASVPVVITDAGDHASRRYVEFFTASIRNKNTRAAYWHACSAFLDACAAGGLSLAQVEPVHVAVYIERLSQERSAPTVKQHLAAIRRMFDFLVVGQVVPSSPASSVRGPKHVVSEGKTPILDSEETRALFSHFDPSKLTDLRDRAILGTMVYSFARVGALVKLRVRDYFRQGAKAWFVLDEKGGKQNRVPAHHLAAEYVEQYIEHAGIGLQRDTPLFRSFGRGRGNNHVTERGLGREEIFAIVRRRAASAGLPPEIGCHSFRGTGITNYLKHGGTIEIAAKLAGHSSTRTTQLYDRRHSEVALAEIERIRF